MERQELLDHLKDFSEREIEYRNNPHHGLSPFYHLLESLHQKDENGIYFIPQELLKTGSSTIEPSATPFFWDRLIGDGSGYQIKKATRF